MRRFCQKRDTLARKVFFCAVFTAVLLAVLLLSSCTGSLGGKTDDLFSDFSACTSAELEMTLPEAVSLFTYRPSEQSLTFSSPEPLCGYSFTASGATYRLSYGDVSVPVDGDRAFLIRLCGEIFSVRSDALSSLSLNGKEGLTEASYHGILYRFRSDGSVESVSGTYDGVNFSCRILSFISPQTGN